MIPPSINLAPIDEGALDGGFKLLFGGASFAVAKWYGDRWVFSNGAELHFTPTAYRPTPRAEDLAA